MEQKMKNLYDVVIIGGGPAGLTAAIYLARARYRVIVVEKETFGGQITITSEVVNYPGVARTDGKSLTETMRRQAQSFGAEFLLAEAEKLELEGDIKHVVTGRGKLDCFGILLATGAHPRMLGFQGEAEFRGHGVAYCATCDGEFFTGKPVFVIGGGFAAAEESVFLTKYASHVTILIRGDDFTCAKTAADAARSNENITVLTNTEVDEVGGDTALRYLKYHNNRTGEQFRFDAEKGDTFGVFVFAGYEPETELVKGIAELDERGYIVTDRHQRTTASGLYAAGDICEKSLRQVVTAVGDGALAATELERYAAKLQEKTGLHPEQPITRLPAETAETSGMTGMTGVPEMAGMSGAAGTAEKTGNAGKSGNTGNTGNTANTANTANGGSALFTPDMLEQLNAVFSRMEQQLSLKLYLDERSVSAELRAYMDELAKLSDKLKSEIVSSQEAEVISGREADGEVSAEEVPADERPAVRVYRADGSFSGLSFHGVPGGHEFTSFVLGLYNAAGPGQAIDADVKAAVRAIEKPVRVKILVSLSCTMCPELVTAAERLAVENPLITVDVYDFSHFAALRETYNVMSVPCMVINEGSPSFGKKNIRQVLELMQDAAK